MTDKAEAGGLAAKEQVFRNRPVGQKVDLLIDGADALGLRLQGIGKADRLARQAQFAFVGLIGPGQDLDQRGFSGPVFAQQGVHLSGAEVEIHRVQRAMRAKDLADPRGAQDHFADRHREHLSHRVPTGRVTQFNGKTDPAGKAILAAGQARRSGCPDRRLVQAGSVAQTLAAVVFALWIIGGGVKL